jgi:hypothetical protein
MSNEIKTAMAKLEYAGLIEPTGEMRWAECSREWHVQDDIVDKKSFFDVCLDVSQEFIHMLSWGFDFINKRQRRT